MGKVQVGTVGGTGSVVTPDQIEQAVEPLIQDHIHDATPHPIYDNLASGRFITYLQNGMA